jgi:hypothetical protein
MQAAETDVAGCGSGPEPTLVSVPVRRRSRARIAAAVLGVVSGIAFFFCAVPSAHSGAARPPTFAGSHLVLDALRLLTRVAAPESNAESDADTTRAISSGGIRN